MKINIFICFMILLLSLSCTTQKGVVMGISNNIEEGEKKYQKIQRLLNEYVEGKDARIGIGVILDEKDTVAVNGDREFPMMSVFKFPLSLAIAEWVDINNMSLNDSIYFGRSELKENTYSPMLEKYGSELNGMSIRELLEWALIESDNNAADILLHRVGGPECATTLLKEAFGKCDITIGASEDDMHRDQFLSYLNRSTPLAMASLFDKFDREIKEKTPSFGEIADMLEKCKTGIDRLAAPLKNPGTIIGHKTGTGFDLPDGRVSALIDCGYVHLPDGRRYAIAVFIADSAYPIEETIRIIAEISEIVFSQMSNVN